MSAVSASVSAPGAQGPDVDVLTVGEPMALFAAQAAGSLDAVADYRRATAGAEFNVAIGLARLGLRTAYITRLGRDTFGRFLHQEMLREGIVCRHLAWDDAAPTGFMLKGRSVDGSDPAIEYFRRGSAASRLGTADAPTVFPARHLHLTGITPALSESAHALVLQLARQARAAGATVSFDPNLRPRLWPSEQAMRSTLNALAAHADLVLPGLAEGLLLTGHGDPEGIADAYLAKGVRQVVVKLGPEGAYCVDRTGPGQYVPGCPVPQVVDTVGAGDGFAVGVVSGLLAGLPLADAVARGNWIGARVVGFPGDADGLPTAQQLAEGLPATMHR